MKSSEFGLRSGEAILKFLTGGGLNNKGDGILSWNH